MRQASNKSATRPFIAALLLTLLTTAAVSDSETHVDAAVAAQKNQYPDLCRDHPTVVEKKTYADYQIKISSAGDGFCHLLDIEKKGRSLYHDEEIGGYFYFGADLEEGSNPFSQLPGKNSVNIVFSKWTGGAHCCYSLHIFELDGMLKDVANIDGGNFSPILGDIDHDGIPEIKVTDDFLAGVFSSFADSATGDVVLKYSHGRYRVDAKHMKKAAPDLKSMNKQINSWQKMLRKRENQNWPPPSLIQAITDLIFTGNKSVALELVDQSWPSDIAGKNDFLKSYEELLNESLFYREFEGQL